MAKKNTTIKATSFTALPSLPKNRSKSLADCICGCGGQTQSEFVAGHDGRSKGLILRLIRGVMTMDDIIEWGGDRGKAISRGLDRMMADSKRMERWGIAEEVAAWFKALEDADEAEEAADASKAV